MERKNDTSSYNKDKFTPFIQPHTIITLCQCPNSLRAYAIDFNLFKAVLMTSYLIKTSKYEISDISPMQSGTSSAHTHVYPSGLVGLSRHIEDELQLALSHGFSTAA